MKRFLTHSKARKMDGSIRQTAIVLAVLSALGISYARSTFVLASNGWVHGSRETAQRAQVDYVVFRGIPYDKPPIGELRFKVS